MAVCYNTNSFLYYFKTKVYLIEEFLMLFGKLPDDIFRPLSGANRHIVEKVLKRLYDLFFDDENPDSDAPRKDIVLHEIYQVLAIEETLALKDEDDESGNIYDTIPAAADYLYRRLLSTGWLEIEEEGYNTNIVPNPGARLLLESLLSIEAQEKKSYGRTVVSILAHIESAINNPKERGIVFLDAVAQTREFSNHLRGILYNLKEVQDLLAKIRDPKLVLSNFFNEFVENILIADYKTLNSSDNPFRYRLRINNLLKQAEYLDTIFLPIAESYKDHFNINIEEAQTRLRRDIEYISRVFRSVDSRLEKIDRFCFRLENRVGETVRFIDRTMPGISNRLADLLTSLGEKFTDDTETTLPGPPLLKQTKLLSPFSLFSPPGKKEKPCAQVLRTRTVNPEIKRHKELIKAYLKKRTFEPLRVANYIDAQMADKVVMSAIEFEIESVDDLLAFLLIRHLHRIQGRGQVQARAFNVIKKTDMIDTDWVKCRNFIVERQKNA